MFDDVLRGTLARIEGARCVVLAGVDGMIVTAALRHADDDPPEAVAASLVELFRRVSAAHRDAGLTPPQEFTSGNPDEQSALRAVTDRYVLMAVLDGVASLGRARFELRKAASAIHPELV